MSFFFFQAEDGIRDLTVTGVQTCALPIYALEEDLAASGAYPEVRPLNLDPGALELGRSEEHTSELQSQSNLVCRLLLEKKTTSQTEIRRVMAQVHCSLSVT